jgi:hypothetical protein
LPSVQPSSLANYIGVAETGGKSLVMDKHFWGRAEKHSVQRGEGYEENEHAGRHPSIMRAWAKPFWPALQAGVALCF